MSDKENGKNEQNIQKPLKQKKKKGRVKVKKQIEVVITDLETVITELGTVVSELRGVLCQIEKVTTHLDGVFGTVSSQTNVPLRETVLSPVPQSNAPSPEGSPSAKRRLESLISGAYEHGAVDTPKHQWKSPNLQLSHTSPKYRNGTSRWFTDCEASFGSLSDVPSSVGSTLSEMLRNAGHIGSRESLASGSVYFAPDKTQGENFIIVRPDQDIHQVEVTMIFKPITIGISIHGLHTLWSIWMLLVWQVPVIVGTQRRRAYPIIITSHHRVVGINLPLVGSSLLRDVNNHLPSGE